MLGTGLFLLCTFQEAVIFPSLFSELFIVVQWFENLFVATFSLLVLADVDYQYIRSRKN